MVDKLQRLAPGDVPSLQEIPDPPRTLYLRGTMPTPETRMLAVVGSRAATPYGRQACEFLIAGLRGYPVAIVSGLAYGIDALAHKTALEAGLQCVAVPGSGLDWDVLYPRANVSLAREIQRRGGALLSEFEPSQKAADYTFPRRNRIMVGLSHAVLVIEAKERSGTLITARLTIEYNRELLVVPGSIFSPQSAGAHQFLKLGATPVTTPADILRALGIEETSPAQSLPDMSEEERALYACIESPRSRDELAEHLAIDSATLGALLSVMEIKGLIKEELGNVCRVL